MKNILVAIDFSDHSLNALQYALKLARDTDAKIELIHSFISIPIIGIDGQPNMIDQTIIDEGIKSAEEKLQQIRKQTDDTTITSVKVTVGEPAHNISKHAQSTNVDLIIAGNLGHSHIEEMLFGSTAVELMKEAPCPVMSIPAIARYTGFKKMVYASELEEKDIQVIKQVCNLAEPFNAEIVVFHAFDEDTMLNQNDAEDFKRLLKYEVSYPKIKRESTTYKDFFEAIIDELQKEKADLVVMREKNRNIFQKIFHRDMVKRINDHTTVPLLTYNEQCLMVKV